MKKKNLPHLTWGEFLNVLANFGVHVAQSVRGGVILQASHHDGDLWHARSDTRIEVKTAGLSAGAIIVGEQLERQCRDSCVSGKSEYAIVFYRNCGRWGKQKRCHLPFRMATSRRRLERFLLRSLVAVYILPADLVQAIYESDPKRIKRHRMGKPGYEYVKVYRKVSIADLRKLFAYEPVLWTVLGKDLFDFETTRYFRRVKFRAYPVVCVPVHRFKFNPTLADDIF